MAQPWGGIASTIYRSKKFRPLSDMHRTAYVYVHTCPHRNAIGLYRLPVVFMADDLDRPPDLCRDALDQLVAARLIDYDHEEALIRVRSWEKLNAPDGPQEAIGRMTRHFDAAPDHEFTVAAFLHFVHHVLHKALGTAKGGDGWNRTEARSKMEDMIFHRLVRLYRADRDLFKAGAAISDIDLGDVVFESLWHKVSDTQRIPYDIPTRYTDTDKDTDKHTDTDRDTDTDTHTDRGAKPQRKAPSSPPSPPAESGRAGRGKLDPDTQRKMASIGQCETCGTKLGYGDCDKCKRIKK